MDRISNPYAPGAGTPPPELAGRDDLLSDTEIALARINLGRPAKSVMLVGLRGVGKTVLLDRIRSQADQLKLRSIRLEAPGNRSLPAILAPQMRSVLLELSRDGEAKELAIRALRALAGFVKSLRVKYSDIEVGLDFDPEAGLADNGDLEHDLQALFESTGRAARAAGTALAIFIDELQYVAEEQLAALITALHRTNQQQLPLVLVGAGLPQLPGQMGKAKSYAERLFDFPTIGPLSRAEAARALQKPAAEQGVHYTAPALSRIVERTQGYPYFLQEWGKRVWDAAPRTPIEPADVEAASIQTIAALDEGFFRVRFDQLTPAEKRYLRAMAALGPGPHRSGDIAERLDVQVKTVAPTRSRLIVKGMVYSPHHGDTAFTVPMFDEFMTRTMAPP